MDTITGMLICNDRRWPEAFRVLALQGAEIVALGFNTPTENLHYGEPPALRVHHHLIMAQSMAFQNATWLVETAKAGYEDGFRMFGHSLIVAPSGEIAVKSQTEEDEVICYNCDIDLAATDDEESSLTWFPNQGQGGFDAGFVVQGYAGTQIERAEDLAADGIVYAEVRFAPEQHLRDGRVIAVMNEPLAEGGSIATYQDITELELSQRRMRDYTLKLERSNGELQEFAYVASHDLQEPLRKIEAFGDRLRTRYAAQLPEDGQLFIDRMQHAAGRMRRLINDLLGYSRVTTKVGTRKKVDLNQTLIDVLGDLHVSQP